MQKRAEWSGEEALHTASSGGMLVCVLFARASIWRSPGCANSCLILYASACVLPRRDAPRPIWASERSDDRLALRLFTDPHTPHLLLLLSSAGLVREVSHGERRLSMRTQVCPSRFLFFRISASSSSRPFGILLAVSTYSLLVLGDSYLAFLPNTIFPTHSSVFLYIRVYVNAS